jgi:hypothetical protein
MNNYELDLKFSELFKELTEVKNTLEQVLSCIKPEGDLWDNSDIIRNWKISERTLAYWRKNGLLSYVQVNGKIWYPRNTREAFLSRHMQNESLNTKEGRAR